MHLVDFQSFSSTTSLSFWLFLVILLFLCSSFHTIFYFLALSDSAGLIPMPGHRQIISKQINASCLNPVIFVKLLKFIVLLVNLLSVCSLLHLLLLLEAF